MLIVSCSWLLPLFPFIALALDFRLSDDRWKIFPCLPLKGMPICLNSITSSWIWHKLVTNSSLFFFAFFNPRLNICLVPWQEKYIPHEQTQYALLVSLSETGFSLPVGIIAPYYMENAFIPGLSHVQSYIWKFLSTDYWRQTNSLIVIFLQHVRISNILFFFLTTQRLLPILIAENNVFLIIDSLQLFLFLW